MAISSPFSPDDTPVDLPDTVRLFNESMASFPRGSLLSEMSSPAPLPTNQLVEFTPRVTAAQVDRQIQETISTREKDQIASLAERQRAQNTDMLIVDQMQNQLTGESTRYAPLRDSL